jgi:hypothetical protein
LWLMFLEGERIGCLKSLSTYLLHKSIKNIRKCSMPISNWSEEILSL